MSDTTPPQDIDLRDPKTANAVADAIVRYHGGGYVPLSVRYPWQFQSRTWQAIDRDALERLIIEARYSRGNRWTTEKFADAIEALVRPVEGVLLTREEIRKAVAPVLVNASSFPRKAQPHLLGQDMGPLIERTVEAIATRLEAL